MNTRATRAAVAALAAAVLVVLGAGIAAAVTSPQYSSADQGCPTDSSSNTFQGAYPGCHNAQVLVRDGNGHTYLEAGTLQTPQQGDNQVHSGTVMVTPNGDGNAYGDPNGSPYANGGGCPPASQYSPPDPGQTQNNQACPPPGAPAASPVTGPGVGLTFDTHWQPLPSRSNPQPGLPSGPPTVTPWVSTGSPDVTALDLVLTGGHVSFGADDNLDFGEHDGVDGQYGSGNGYNGTSDGGGLGVSWQPAAGAATVVSWVSMIQAAAGEGSLTPLAPILEDPVPVVHGGGNGCADGVCFGAFTDRETMYQGGGGGGSQRDVYNYQGKQWGPASCNSGSPQNEQACQDPSQGGTQACPANNTTDNSCGINYYRQAEASNVTSEPGVMIFADPDPQASPALPLDPLPAFYAGTCGVVAGGGQVKAPAKPPANPLLGVNDAGQVVAADPTGC